MARLSPLRAITYNPQHIRLGGVLAPPYDVIDDAERQRLYAQDLRNIVRIDAGADYPGDEPLVIDRHTRARAHMDAWLHMGLLLRDEQPCLYVSAHEFCPPDGAPRRRLGILGRVLALPWGESDLRPHERTLRAPKEDRLQLLRATGVQTSPVFGMWDRAPAIDPLLAEITGAPALLGGRSEGDKHLLWRVSDADMISALQAALAPSTLYVADGHHRYETAVAYAAEQRADHPSAALGERDSDHCLVYLCGADDPGLTVLPTHRMVRPRPDMPATCEQLGERLEGAAEVVPVDSLEQAVRAAGLRRAGHHAFGVALARGSALVAWPRDPAASVRDALDVVALEQLLLRRLGIDAEAIADGALTYTRDLTTLEQTVASSEAAVGITVNPTSITEVMAVADAGETMPQKSTYFFPKVPTGLLLSPV